MVTVKHNCLRGAVLFVHVLLILTAYILVSSRVSYAEELGVSPILRNTLAAYDREPRVKDRVDIERLLNSLKEASINTYNFLIWHKPSTDYEDFVMFLEAALQEGIYVWVDITPPSEPPNPPPHGTDYVAWAVDFANLSLRFPNLVAFTIDDFDHNLEFFTPDYVKRMWEAFKAVNPRLAFIPTVYGGEQLARHLTYKEFVEKYGDYIDGILLPYRNLDSLDDLPEILKAAREALGNGKVLISFIYASSTSWRRSPPSLDYLRKAILISYLYADGVMMYCLPLVPEQGNFEEYQLIKEMYPLLSKWPNVDRTCLIDTFNYIAAGYEREILALRQEIFKLRLIISAVAVYAVIVTALLIKARRRAW